MLSAHIRYTIESYRLSDDRPGSFGDEIIIEGWFLAYESIREMRLIFPGQAEFIIEDRHRPSRELFDVYGDFGEPAKNARFLLIEQLTGQPLSFENAVLQVSIGEHHAVQAKVGHLFRQPQRTGYPKDQHDLVMHFESVGDNCEFGLVQRRVGSERLSLFRYAGIGDVFRLASSIESAFEGFAENGDLAITKHEGEWMAYVHSAGIAMHTGRRIEQISYDKILIEERRKLIFMAQKFLGDCEAAEKIFVYRVHKDERGGPDGTRGMHRLYDALSRIGPVSLLWVNVADGDHPHGAVHRVRDRLYRGYIDHLAPASNAFDFRIDSWLDLLSNAETVVERRTDDNRLRL